MMLRISNDSELKTVHTSDNIKHECYAVVTVTSNTAVNIRPFLLNTWHHVKQYS